MSYEKAMELLINLMIENQDVLLRLKEGDDTIYTVENFLRIFSKTLDKVLKV